MTETLPSFAVTIAPGVTWHAPGTFTASARTHWSAFYRAAWKNYGITPAEYRGLYYAQGGRCYICRVARGKHPDDPKETGGRRLGIDHNHAIGPKREAVRGLLCTGGDKTCNRIIGWLQAPALERAAYLLRAAPAQRALSLLDWGKTAEEILRVLADDIDPAGPSTDELIEYVVRHQ